MTALALDRPVPRPHRESHRYLATGERLEQFALDRQCKHEGCTARLSRYNPSDHCSAHQGWHDTAKRSYG
jgi:hypothetical protein